MTISIFFVRDVWYWKTVCRDPEVLPGSFENAEKAMSFLVKKRHWTLDSKVHIVHPGSAYVDIL